MTIKNNKKKLDRIAIAVNTTLLESCYFFRLMGRKVKS